jgi:hypothetical protein
MWWLTWRAGIAWLFGLVYALSAAGQTDQLAKPSLEARYESAASYYQLTEDAFRIAGLKSSDRDVIAVRVCSNEPLLLAMAKGLPTPFTIADAFVNRYAYVPEKVFFIRSEDCLSSKPSSTLAVEVWAVPKGAALPPRIETLTFNQIRVVSLGKIPANRGVRDYGTAVRKLVDSLKETPESIGVVVGYYLERPSRMLRRRLKEASALLQHSGLPPNRYIVRPQGWYDEVSVNPPDTEPQYPDVFLVEMTGAGNAK